MHLFVRADAWQNTGTGHIMRCLALAQGWKDRGGRVTFITYCNSDALRQRLVDEGFEVRCIENPHPNSKDLKVTIEILKNATCAANSALPATNWLVCDGYHFDPGYQRAIRDAGQKLMIIDDYNHLPSYCPDILLNQNIGAESYEYRTDVDTKKVLGTKYALLRREFLSCENIEKRIPEKARKILVTMGGTDANNVTKIVVEAICLLNDSELDIKVVIGPANENFSSLEETKKKVPCELELIKRADMPQLIRWADLAVSAGGSTVWELCFFGLPMLLVVVASNHSDLVNRLEKTGAVASLGWYKDMSPNSVARTIEFVIASQEIRKNFSIGAKNVVDGKGVRRILRCLLVGDVSLRETLKDDRYLLFQWVNDPIVRQNSFFGSPVIWKDHVQWLNAKIDDPNCFMFIAMNQNKLPVGQIRFDIEDDIAEIHYSVDKSFRGLGIGKEMIEEGINTIKREQKKALEFQARVLNDNIASARTFEKLGFIEKRSDEVKTARSDIYDKDHALLFWISEE